MFHYKTTVSSNVYLASTDHLFDDKKKHGADHPPVGQRDLDDRRRLAHDRLAALHAALPRVLDALQSPALNKQLMYTLLDAVLIELWPELDPMTAANRKPASKLQKDNANGSRRTAVAKTDWIL